MIRAFNYPLRLTAAQATTFVSWTGACQRIYNAALQERRDAYRKLGKSPSLYDQHKSLTEIRAADPEYAAIPVLVLRSALARIDLAFKAFFRRVKLRQTPGYPRFKARDRYRSFDLGTNSVRLDGDRLSIPKLGAVRLNLYRPLPAGAKIREVRIRRRQKGDWVASLVCDVGAAPPKVAPERVVGIDLGLENFATLSTGEVIDNPRFFRKAEEALARRQQALARKKRGSKSRQRAKVLVAKSHEHIANQRRDFARKLAVNLFARYDVVAHEDLNIRAMARGLNLSKSIHDAAWGLSLRCLACKAESAGKHDIGVDPRGTSQRCSRCGSVCPKTLSDREHRCSCGPPIHRDHNAAINIEALGLSALEAA